jgi:tetratricopeptide (TPR) repeat protein
MTYYQALALMQLGQRDSAINKLEELLSFARGQLDKKVSIDYFATSLPNFLLFEDDLQKRNRTEYLYLIGLAQQGLGKPDEAERAFREVLTLDPNDLQIQETSRST